DGRCRRPLGEQRLSCRSKVRQDLRSGCEQERRASRPPHTAAQPRSYVPPALLAERISSCVLSSSSEGQHLTLFQDLPVPALWPLLGGQIPSLARLNSGFDQVLIPVRDDDSHAARPAECLSDFLHLSPGHSFFRPPRFCVTAIRSSRCISHTPGR